MAEHKPLRTVAILTLGCKLNQADSDALARSFAAAGCAVTSTEEGADAVVINSCTVTHVADSKARQLVRRARRSSPEATVVLTGCYVDSAGPDPGIRAGADLALANRAKPDIVDAVFRRRTGESARPEAAGERPPLRGLRSRAFVKIQEGCNDVCAFCIVPRVRGREDSRPIAEIVAEAQQHEAAGAREIVLTGTQLGHYGRDRGWEAGPRRLLEALLERTTIPRIRLSSLQAQDIFPGLLDLWSDRRLCPHFHLPLQSGSDAVLKRMRRRYTSARYRSAVEMIRSEVADVAITTDVIAGFPGETEAEHHETVVLCREAGFAALHVFPYSIRQGTSAALLGAQLTPEVKRARADELIALGRESGRAFRRSLLGSTHDVLWEEPSEPGAWFGLTPNYQRVRVDSQQSLANTITPTRLHAPRGDLIQGDVVGLETDAYADIGMAV
ncbi:MAG: tRNA (N(6)-L-threonylcarbamoyladenosine(37)-C(2))-methylthiotransferase MtaB [Dehalococcoidia bacterium]